MSCNQPKLLFRKYSMYKVSSLTKHVLSFRKWGETVEKTPCMNMCLSSFSFIEEKCLYTANTLGKVHAAIKSHNHNSLTIWRDVDTSGAVFFQPSRKTSGLRLALFSNVTDGVKKPGRLQPQAAINKGNAWFLANSVSGVLSLFSDKRNLAAQPNQQS